MLKLLLQTRLKVNLEWLNLVFLEVNPIRKEEGSKF